MDVVAFQVVTGGHAATERFDRMQAAADYSEAYYFHGLAVQTAEATAEYLHRQALGLHQLIADAVAMTYTTSVALRRRQLHAACRSTPCLVAATRRYA